MTNTGLKLFVKQHRAEAFPGKYSYCCKVGSQFAADGKSE